MVLPSSRTQKDLDTWDAALKAYDSEDFDAALSIFEQMFDDPKALMNLGLIHMYQGNFGLAISKFVDTVRLDRSLAVGYFQRGVCHYKLKAMDKALQDFSDAEFMMRGNDIVDYEELGLHFQLRADKILLNKGLALIEIGRKYEGMNLLLQFGTTNAKPELYSMPSGILFRIVSSSPPLDDQHATDAESNDTFHPKSTLTYPSPSIPGPPSDSSSTYAPSLSECDSMSSQEGSSFMNKKNELQSSSSTRYLSLANSSATSSSTLRHLRTDLVEVLGPDLLVPTTEISSIPCAGVRIASGNLLGLMGWRLIVELDESEEMDRSWRRKQPGKSVMQHKKLSVVSNFILDTGSAKSSVSQETLRALKYQGSYNPGTEVKLRIQGISTQCLVATLGEASRLGGQFMTSGNLTFYFDKKLNAPVLYVGDESNERPTSHIPRTVNVTGMDHRNHRKSLRDSMSSILSSLSFMKHNDSGC